MSYDHRTFQKVLRRVTSGPMAPGPRSQQLLQDYDEQTAGSDRSEEDNLVMKTSAKSSNNRHYLYSLLATLLCVSALGLTARYVSYYPNMSSNYVERQSDCEITAPYIFDSVFGLLKQWKNLYAPNGHSVVVASIPPGTPLYHARPTSWTGTPKKPTFYALDAEMSLGIYGASGTPTIHTMVTTKRLSVLYFDGTSASLTNTGSLDSQTAILRGHVLVDPGVPFVYNESARAHELCAFVNHLRIDGIVRMDAGFELLVCDYDAAGIVSSFTSNLTFPGQDARDSDPDLPKDPNRSPPHGFGNWHSEQNSWEWFRSSTWHYGSSISGGGSTRERRVQLDMCGFMTYYSPKLKSLSGQHHGGIQNKETYQNGWGLRRGHRLLSISVEDTQTMRTWIEKSMTPGGKCSGVEWQALTETIVDQHGTRAREIAAVFERANEPEWTTPRKIIKVHELSHAILHSYLEYPAIVGKSFQEIENQTLARCSSIYTDYIDKGQFNEFEMLIRDSTKLVLESLCKWEWELYVWSEARTTNQLNNLESATRQFSFKDKDAELNLYGQKTKNIMKWIGWDLWEGCERMCNWDELCYIPMWPVVYAPHQRQGGIYAGEPLDEDQLRDFFAPKCISRYDFDRGGGRGREPNYQLPPVWDVPYDDSLRDHSRF